MAIFESYSRFPIFQNCSTDELFTLLTKVCLDFEKVPAGACILEADTHSKGLLFLLEGSITQQGGTILNAPAQLAVERIFGEKNISCPAIYAKTDCHLMYIDQEGLLRMFQLSPKVLQSFLCSLSDYHAESSIKLE